MEKQKVDMYLMTNGKYFPEENLTYLREQLLNADEDKWGLMGTLQFKDPIMVLIISVLVGHLGIDRFYLGQTSLGIIKLLTCGGLGIWTIIDLFLIMGATREVNYEKFVRSQML